MSASQVEQLQQSLRQYHLGDYQLSLTQLTKGNYITPKEFQDYMKQSDTNDTIQTSTNSDDNASLTNVQNDIVKKYPKQISNIFVGQVQDKANHTISLIAIQLSDNGKGKAAEIEKAATKTAANNNVNAVVRMMTPSQQSD